MHIIDEHPDWWTALQELLNKSIVDISDLRTVVEENKWENMRRAVCERESWLLDSRELILSQWLWQDLWLSLWSAWKYGRDQRPIRLRHLTAIRMSLFPPPRTDWVSWRWVTCTLGYAAQSSIVISAVVSYGHYRKYTITMLQTDWGRSICRRLFQIELMDVGGKSVNWIGADVIGLISDKFGGGPFVCEIGI